MATPEKRILLFMVKSYQFIAKEDRRTKVKRESE
jgi:hypothetical protein